MLLGKPRVGVPAGQVNYADFANDSDDEADVSMTFATMDVAFLAAAETEIRGQFDDDEDEDDEEDDDDEDDGSDSDSDEG